MNCKKAINFHNSFFFLCVYFILILALIGCKASPAKLTTYLSDTSKMVKLEELPFNQAWYDQTINWFDYKELYIAPVNTTYIGKQSWWDNANFSGDREEAVKETAQYLQDAVKQSFINDPKHAYTVVDLPDSKTLILELALTELVPTKAWLNSISYVGVFMAVDSGTVAIEGKLRKGINGDIVGMFADRQQGKRALVSVADLTWNSHARQIMDDWSEQLVAISNAKEGEKVESSSTFTLKPW